MLFFKQPLIHFLLLGGLVFAGYQWLDQGEAESEKVVINRNSFLEFLQYRNKGIGADSAEKMLAGLSAEQQSTLLEKHIEEEVLFREALNLGLDKKDYVIKQRLIQKMTYLLDGAATEEQTLETSRVEDYFSRNQSRYFLPATVTFTHVFIQGEGTQGESPQQRAETIKAQLNQQQIPFEQATRFGDRFVYYTNYVERDREFIAAHFGDKFAESIFAQTPSNQSWFGPVQSEYGWHLVKLVGRQSGGVPPLDTIYNRVLQDALLENAQKQRQKTIQQLIDSYGIDMPALLATVGATSR